MKEKHSRMVMKLLDAEDDLTAWEWDFINDLADREEPHALGASQEKKLEEIYRKVGEDDEEE